MEQNIPGKGFAVKLRLQLQQRLQIIGGGVKDIIEMIAPMDHILVDRFLIGIKIVRVLNFLSELIYDVFIFVAVNGFVTFGIFFERKPLKRRESSDRGRVFREDLTNTRAVATIIMESVVTEDDLVKGIKSFVFIPFCFYGSITTENASVLVADHATL